MSSKKKLLVSMLVVAFVLLSIIATVAIAFALTQQTIKTSLNIGYTVEDIDGTASATFTIGGVTENLTAMKGENVIGDKLVFKAGDTENAGNLMFPEDALALTAQNDNVVIQYTYSNTGAKHYIASMDLNANIEKDNMKVEYSIDGTAYSEQPYAVVVPANTANRSYWIKISIIDKAKSASFTGDFDWLLDGCDPQSAEYLTLTSTVFQAVEGQTGAYSAKLTGTGSYIPGDTIVFPSEVGEDKVTTIAESSLSDEEKALVKSVYIPDTVTTIGEQAFDGFTNLDTVTFEQNESVSVASVIDSGLTAIGTNSFNNCKSLTEITIPNTVASIYDSAFGGCTGLTEITIPSSVTYISITNDSAAFEGCTNLKNVTIDTTNSNVTTAVWELAEANGELHLTIGESVTSTPSGPFFSNCTQLKSVIIGNNVTTIGSLAFYNCTGITNLILGDSVSDVQQSAFEGCTGLTEITIPKSLTTVGDGIFKGCTNLTRVIFENGTTTIGNVCANMTSLTEVVIPNSVTTIGANAFYCCSALENITIPNGVTTIGNSAFWYCTALASIEIPNSVTTIESMAFCGSGLTEVTIPNSVTTVGDNAFLFCFSLTSAKIGNGVAYLDGRIFQSCPLTTIQIAEGNAKYYVAGNCVIEKASKTLVIGCKTSVIPTDGSVTSIADSAFVNCSGLTEIIIPDSVISIGSYAFSSSGLTSVTFTNPNGWTAGSTSISSADLSNPSTAANYLNSTYESRTWTRS